MVGNPTSSFTRRSTWIAAQPRAFSACGVCSIKRWHAIVDSCFDECLEVTACLLACGLRAIPYSRSVHL
jgi:hypothetical protein